MRRIINPYRTLFIWAFFTSCMTSLSSISHAETSWPVEIYKARDGKSEEPMSLKARQRFTWAKTPEGARILKSNVLLEIPLDLEAQKPTAENENTKIKIKGNKILVGAGAMGERISFGNSQIEIRLKPTKPTVIDENCETAGVKLRPQGPMAPFFLGTTCPIVNKELSLHLTFPSDVDLIQSSLFEIMGKGESWRVYDLKRATSATAELGRFDFLYKGKTYTYTLVSLKTDPVEKKIPQSDFTLGLGYVQLKLSSNDAQGSESKPLVRAEILPHKLWNNFGAGGTFETAVGFSSSSTTSLSYMQVAPYAFYQLQLSSGFLVQPRVYYVVSNQSSGTGVSYQANQVGAGALLQASFPGRWTLRLEYMMASLGSQLIKSHMLVNVSLLQKSAKSSFCWGAGFQMQSYGVVDSTNINRKFDQMGFYGIIGF